MKFFRLILKIFLFFVFLISYFLFIFNFYVIPGEYEFPIVILIGFIMIITCFFLFINTNQKITNEKVLKIKFLSENTIKIFLLIFMGLTYFIPPISNKAIISWNSIGFLNYIRGIIFLIGCAFVPGSNLYNIFFPENTLHKRYNVESYFIKITLYPLLSFGFLGSSVLILDICGLVRSLFAPILFLMIIILFFIDFIIQEIRSYKIKLELVKIYVSKSTFIILLLSMGFIFVSIGFQLSAKYLNTGDTWSGISMCKYIGSTKTSPLKKHFSYTHYWGYITFGLSVISGLPYININVMLAPFTYLSVTSMYLLMKAILYKFKDSYAVLSTLLACSYSSLFYIFNYNLGMITTDWFSISSFVYDLIIEFRYKSFAHLLFIFSLSLFIILFKTNKNDTLQFKQIIKTEEFKITILGVWLLIQSYITYFIPLLAIAIFIFTYCLISDKKKQNFQLLILFTFIFLIVFIIYDIMMLFIPSNISIGYTLNFMGEGFTGWQGTEWAFYRALMVYSIIGLIFGLCIFTYIIYNKYFIIKFHKFKINLKLTFIPLLVMFSLFFLIFILNIMEELEFHLNENNKDMELNIFEKYFITYYLYNVFLKIGFVGVLGVYLSYFTYQEERRLFFILITWFIVIILVASSLFMITWLKYPYLNEIPDIDYKHMRYWFNRFWYYSIIPLSILASIGLISLNREINQRIKRIRLLRYKNINKNINIILKNISVSILIFLSVSNLIFCGIWTSNYYADEGINDDDAQILGWIAENIPHGSKILVDKYKYFRALRFLGNYECFFIQNVYEDAFLQEQEDDYWYNEWIYTGDSKVSMIKEIDTHLDVFELDDQNNDANARIKLRFPIPQIYGTIEFWVRITDATKLFYIYFDGQGSTLINFQISNKTFRYYDGQYNKICNIESNEWYKIKIDFECSNNAYKDLQQYQWHLSINNNNYSNLDFWGKKSEIVVMNFMTSTLYSGFSVYLDDIRFSWAPNFQLEKCVPIVLLASYLEKNDINYLLLSPEDTYYKSRVPPLFIESELVPYIFDKKLNEHKGIKVYSAL